jgi:hypothetical protein
VNHKNGNLALSLYVVEGVERRFGKCIGVKSKGTHEKVFFCESLFFHNSPIYSGLFLLWSYYIILNILYGASLPLSSPLITLITGMPISTYSLSSKYEIKPLME